LFGENFNILKILLVHRYFKPDKTSCSNILYEVARFLAKKNKVDVLSSLPFNKNLDLKKKKLHKEILENINIERIYLKSESKTVFLRILNAFKLSINIINKVVKNKYDIIIVTSSPPILCAFVASIIAKLLKKRMIYYCMDINPEISLVLNDLSNNFLYKFFLFVENITCKIANPILVHSNDMMKTLRKRKNGKNYNIKIINNFATLDNIDNQKIKSKLILKKKYFNDKKLKLIYAGNIGRFQDLKDIIKSISEISIKSKVEMIIMGNGTEKINLINFVKKKDLGIKFLDYQSPKIAKMIISQADLGVVTLTKNMYSFAYPSKVMTYLQQGIPMICTIEKNSEIVTDMLSMKYGFWTPRGNTKKFAQLIDKLLSKKSWKSKMKKNTKKAHDKKFCSGKVLINWQNIIDQT
jgi:glycosyltransferase involved in cell wall biosynthesis